MRTAASRVRIAALAGAVLGAMLADRTVAGRAGAAPVLEDDGYLAWTRDHAETIARSMRSRDSAGQTWWDTRGTRTDRSMRYKVVATWMTPEVIRATARVLQLREGLSAATTRALVAEADRPGETIAMIDIDPHEGSGVIPLDWQAYLQTRHEGRSLDGAVAGTNTPRLRDVRALAGIDRRDYAFDRFWMVFPLKNADGKPLFDRNAAEAELVVRIYEKEARLKWPVPQFMRPGVE